MTNTSYVPSIYKLLDTRKPGSELFDYLWWLETEHMGLPGDRQATELFAHRLIENFARLDSEE